MISVCRNVPTVSIPRAPWTMVLLIAVWTGYSLGSSSKTILSLLEDWIHNIGVSLYTLFTVLYLSVRWYYDRAPEASKSFGGSTEETLVPSLRMASTITMDDLEKDGEPRKELEAELPAAPIDLNGTFKVVDNDNFGSFLNAQGLPWFLCNAAAKARPTHTFEHHNYRDLTIHIQGIIESQTAYTIDGPHTETTIRGRVFHDSVEYLYESSDDDEVDEDGVAKPKKCVGIQTNKVALGEGYHVEVKRRIIRAGEIWTPPEGHGAYDLETPSDKDRLIMMNEVVFDDDPNKASVLASQLFHRMD